MNIRRAVLLSCLLVSGAGVNAGAPGAKPAQPLTVVSDTALTWIVNAYDVRWNSSGRLLLAGGRSGVLETSVPPTEAATRTIMPGGSGGVFMSSRLAASDDWTLSAAPFGAFNWQSARPQTSASIREQSVAVIVDADIHGRQVAILGGDRGDRGEWSPDGTIAWTGILGNQLQSFRPLMTARGGKGDLAMARCHFLETGAVRYMPDGSLIVVPGVEPGVFRYAPDGKLLETWQTESLGIVDRCRFDDREMAMMAADPVQRNAWLNQRVTVEDIIPLPHGPALLLREVVKQQTVWRMVTLSSKGKHEVQDLPVRSPSTRAHARAAVRGAELALLVTEYEIPAQKSIPPRLVVLRGAI